MTCNISKVHAGGCREGGVRFQCVAPSQEESPFISQYIRSPHRRNPFAQAMAFGEVWNQLFRPVRWAYGKYAGSIVPGKPVDPTEKVLYGIGEFGAEQGALFMVPVVVSKGAGYLRGAFSVGDDIVRAAASAFQEGVIEELTRVPSWVAPPYVFRSGGQGFQIVTQEGKAFIEFDARLAALPQDFVLPGGSQSPRAIATLVDDTVVIIEGRHRGVSAAFGDFIPPEVGGMGQRHWLRYEFYPYEHPYQPNIRSYFKNEREFSPIQSLIDDPQSRILESARSGRDPTLLFPNVLAFPKPPGTP